MSFSTYDELYEFLRNPIHLKRRRDDERYLDITREELLSVTRTLSGKQGEDYVTGVLRGTLASSDGFRVDPLGGICTPHSKDIHIYPLSDHYNIVYWGGDGAEHHRLWTFQISQRRSVNRNRPVVFDKTRDAPVDLNRHGIVVSMPCEGEPQELKEGLFMVREGGMVWIEIGGHTIPVTFPMRSHPHSPPGHIMLPL